MIRSVFGPVTAVLLSLVLLSTLILLTSAAQHADVSGEFYSLLLGVNVLGIVMLSALIAGNVWRLARQFRAKRLGSRLTLRMVGTFVLLVVIPLSMVYYFSIQFLNKGVDSWFDVRVEHAVEDALLLGRTTLEVIKQEAVDELSDGAARLADVGGKFEIIQLLDDLRERDGYLELSFYTQTGRIIASSHQEAQSLIPDTPDEAILSQIRTGKEYVSLEPVSGGAQQLRVVVPVYARQMGEPIRALQALKLLPLRYAKLAESVESASAQYKQMVFSRAPLKFALMLSLTLVTLVAMLIAVWAAIYVARRLVAPLRDLAEGTRAVAQGDYRKELPVTSSDELGVLVGSFNEMTSQIHKAQSAARRAHREAEEQRAHLETVLGHLSSGVLSFDRRFRLMTQNSAAEQILGIELTAGRGVTLTEIAASNPRLEPFLSAMETPMRDGLREWQAEVSVFGARGRQVLISRGTMLPRRRALRGGYVVVFDDVTDLIQAQRDAAWGEVARRLAHEIKNPLTPIQLSAERIRHKYLAKLDGKDRGALDRATRTIVQQVESLKGMVNAFASYAQPVRMDLKPLNLNQLIQDVAELHQSGDNSIRFTFQLDAELPELQADAGRLRQVLNNLIINARDALVHVDEPQIRIETRNIDHGDHSYVEMSVADNGPGIPEVLLERLFEPYVTTKERGTGLGLAIVKRIVEEHGGAIWVENPPKGGARVTVRMPLAVERESNVTDLNLKLGKIRAVGDHKG